MVEKKTSSKSVLEEERLHYQPTLPHQLYALNRLVPKEGNWTTTLNGGEKVKEHFPKTFGLPLVQFEQGYSVTRSQQLRVGVVFSGGQASGGHNVITGLFDSLKKLNPASQLFGFLDGPKGIIENRYRELLQEELSNFRNTGGFDLLGSGRTKIETKKQFEDSLRTVQALRLDGLVIIGGDDSNTNAALLAEYFLTQKCHAKVIGVPKTIDGDLKNTWVEISFGFDTACKIYAEIIGNIARDALSAKKYYHFIKLMGRSASHVTLECALQVHPNMTLIGEEIAEKKMTLQNIAEHISDMIIHRSEKGKAYGVILIPEGLIEFVPEMRLLIKEINALLAKNEKEVETKLSAEAKKTFSFLPIEISQQLLLDRDPHGNVQVSHIATEKLLIHAVKQELKKRPTYKGEFNPVNHFLGYEGRAGFPSNFDANYCYALGFVSTALINAGYTGYMSSLQHLSLSVEQWVATGLPLTMMMHIEERKGEQRPVIQKSLVSLKKEPFLFFAKQREAWEVNDYYRFPGPVVLFGPSHLCDETTITLKLENKQTVKI